jgi:hypothetical protein
MAGNLDPGRGTPVAASVEWTAPDPPHPLWQLTGSELDHYLTLLEAVRNVAPADHPIQEELEELVDLVRAEQDERQQARETWPTGMWGVAVVGPGKAHGSGDRP